MAVVLGALLLGAIGLFNTSQTKTTALNQFNLLCENYYYETQELGKECMLKEYDFEQELEKFKQFFLEQNSDVTFEEHTYVTEPYKIFTFTMTQEKDGEIYKCIK